MKNWLLKKWWKIGGKMGVALCRFGLWLTNKTVCLAQDHNDMEEHRADQKKFQKLLRSFRIQSSNLELVEEKESVRSKTNRV